MAAPVPRAAVLALLALVLGGTGCGDLLTLSPVSEQAAEAEEDLDPVSAEPFVFMFTHVVGDSPCPQLIGRLTIRNAGRTGRLVFLELGRHLSTNGVESVLVAAGGTAVVDVYFDCSTQVDFLSSITLSDLDDVIQVVFVNGTVGTL